MTRPIYAFMIIAVLCAGARAASMPADVAAEVAKFKDANPRVRQQALSALGKMGDKAKPALPQILEMTNDKTTWVMTRSLMVIADIGPDETAIPSILPFLAKDREFRDLADTIFVKLGVKAVPALVGALKDDTTAEGACEALAAIGRAAKSAAPDLTAASQKGKTKPIRDAAATALKAVSK